MSLEAESSLPGVRVRSTKPCNPSRTCANTQGTRFHVAKPGIAVWEPRASCVYRFSEGAVCLPLQPPSLSSSHPRKLNEPRQSPSRNSNRVDWENQIPVVQIDLQPQPRDIPFPVAILLSFLPASLLLSTNEEHAERQPISHGCMHARIFPSRPALFTCHSMHAGVSSLASYGVA